jgi:hypothetical protein
MSSSSTAAAITRGRTAEDVLRHDTLKAACEELNRRAYLLFVTSADDTQGDIERERARRMVQGAEGLLDILKEWVVEGRDALENMDEGDA